MIEYVCLVLSLIIIYQFRRRIWDRSLIETKFRTKEEYLESIRAYKVTNGGKDNYYVLNGDHVSELQASLVMERCSLCEEFTQHQSGACISCQEWNKDRSRYVFCKECGELTKHKRRVCVSCAAVLCKIRGY